MKEEIRLSNRKPSEVLNDLPFGEMGLWGTVTALAWYIEQPMYGPMIEDEEDLLTT